MLCGIPLFYFRSRRFDRDTRFSVKRLRRMSSFASIAPP